jgi:hypothetical protein
MENRQHTFKIKGDFYTGLRPSRVLGSYVNSDHGVRFTTKTELNGTCIQISDSVSGYTWAAKNRVPSSGQSVYP